MLSIGLGSSSNSFRKSYLNAPESSDKLKEEAIIPSESPIQVSAASAALVGFVSRVLIEKSFFQNSQIPVDMLLYLANDLIKTFVPQKKGYLVS